MIKKLVKILLLGLLILLVSKAFIAFTAYQAISQLKDQYADDFLLTYQWLSSSLNGVVSLEDVEITPYTMKKTFAIDDVSFVYPDYVSLLFGLSALNRGELSGLKTISLSNIQTELTGKSFKELLSTELSPVWFTPFNLYGCGKYTALSAKEYELMGIQQHNMSLKIDLEQLDQKLETLTIDLDGQELGEMSISAKFPTHSLQRAIKDNAFDELKLHFLSLEYQDAGFFRRLNILCNQRGQQNRTVFSMTSAIQWKDAMFSRGFLVNEVLIKMYSDYLLQGGAISFEATTAEEGLRITDLNSLVDKEIFSYLDADLVLNGNTVEDPQLYLDSATLFPPPVIEKPSEPKIIETPKQKAGYRTVSLERVAEYLDKKIRVVMQDGKRYEGLLTETAEYNLVLIQNLAGGEVHYHLMLNKIETFEVWFNKEK